MGPDAAAVATAASRWIWVPEGTRVEETDDWLVARYPEWAYTPLLLARFTPSGDPVAALDAAVAAAQRLAPDLASLEAVASIASPPGSSEAFAARGGVVVEEVDVLAVDLSHGVPDLGGPAAGVTVEWATTPELATAANAATATTFDAPRITAERAATVAAKNAVDVTEGRGAMAVALLGEDPVGSGGLEVDGPDARLYGGGVVPQARGRGVYRSLLGHRLRYAVEHGATIALTRGRVETSGPILRRAGFAAFGRELTYRLPLTPSRDAASAAS